MKKMFKTFFTTTPYVYFYIAAYTAFAFINIKFIDKLGKTIDIASKDKSEFKDYAISLVVLMCIAMLFNIVFKLTKNVAQNKINMKIRTKIGHKILSKDVSLFSKNDSEYYVGSLVNDVKLVEEQFVLPLLLVIGEIIYLVLASIQMFAINVETAILVLVLCSLPAIVPMLFMPRLQSKMGNYMVTNNEFLQSVTEYIDGHETFSNYDEIDYVKNKFNKKNKKLIGAKKDAYLFMETMMFQMMVLISAIVIGILIFGMFMALKGKITIGEVFVLQFMSGFVVDPINCISQYVPQIIGCKEAIEKYNSLCEDARNNKRKASFNNRIVCKQGTFEVDNRKILDNVNIEFEKGYKYALVGGSGSGKSTLIKAILGQYEEAEGDIIYDGTDITNIDKNSIFNEITYLSQTASMFVGTVRDNLTMFNSKFYSDEVIYEVLELVNLKDKVLSLDRGLDTYLEENGDNFSGGEKQRISIARALLKGKNIFVLDEVTSALDYDNYINIERLLMSVKDATIISITHRLNAKVLNAYDKIFVMDEGKLVESGTFKELVNGDGVFGKLYEAQNI